MEASNSQTKRLRTKAAAEYCGVSAALLEKFRLHRTGPAFIKIGGAVVYDSADLDAWLAKGRVAPDAGSEAA